MNPILEKSQVKEIPLATSRPFIERWHYSGCVPTGKNIFLGWYTGTLLYAVADYGVGVNPYQAAFLSRTTGHDVTKTNLLELKRLCRIEPKNPSLPLTAFLSRCHKLLKRLGYTYIISFSDPGHGHNGGIYKAANFTYLGTTNPEYHAIDKDGNIRHRRYYYRYARRNGVTMAEARTELGLRRVKTAAKDRWFLVVG